MLIQLLGNCWFKSLTFACSGQLCLWDSLSTSHNCSCFKARSCRVSSTPFLRASFGGRALLLRSMLGEAQLVSRLASDPAVIRKAPILKRYPLYFGIGVIPIPRCPGPAFQEIPVLPKDGWLLQSFLVKIKKNEVSKNYWKEEQNSWKKRTSWENFRAASMSDRKVLAMSFIVSYLTSRLIKVEAQVARTEETQWREKQTLATCLREQWVGGEVGSSVQYWYLFLGIYCSSSFSPTMHDLPSIQTEELHMKV